jgi:NAD(P)-dependent dehydrogenase (short-subunit alcohol dehydrogenase family)
MTRFGFEQVPDMTNKVVIVTGANNGVGKVSALEIARKGAHV